MKRYLLLISVVIVCSLNCSDPDNARRVLTSNGYTEIRLTGYKWFACSSGDNFTTGFIAKSPSGQEVEGCVCSGIFKGSTIRFK